MPGRAAVVPKRSVHLMCWTTMKPSDRSLVASRLLLRSRWLFALAAIAAGLAVAFLLGGCTSLPGVARALAADTNTLHQIGRAHV